MATQAHWQMTVVVTLSVDPVAKRSDSSVRSVGKPSVSPNRWRSTRGCTQGRSHSAATCAKPVSQTRPTWRGTRGSTQGRNHSAATCAELVSPTPPAWRGTRESTQGRNPSAAPMWEEVLPPAEHAPGGPQGEEVLSEEVPQNTHSDMLYIYILVI